MFYQSSMFLQNAVTFAVSFLREFLREFPCMILVSSGEDFNADYLEKCIPSRPRWKLLSPPCCLSKTGLRRPFCLFDVGTDAAT